MQLIDTTERRRRLGVRHHLSAPGPDLVSVAGDLCGLHSSDPATVYLSARARVADLAVEDVAAILYDERSLVRMLGMRRTMFVVPRDLAAVMQIACAAPRAVGERRRMIGLVESQELAGDGAAWFDDVSHRVVASLRRRGSATAVELTEDVPELSGKFRFGEGKTWAGTMGASTRVLFLLAAEGRIVRGRPRGSWLSSQYRWAPLESWLGGELEKMEEPEARRRLVQRWLHTYGPGTVVDVSWWTGWGKRVTMEALRMAGAVEVSLGGNEPGYLLADDLDATPVPEPWAALLPALDPLVMGWKRREWFLGGHGGELFDRNGNAGPTVWWNGRVVGGWSQRNGGRVVMELLEDVGAEGRDAVEAERDRLESWLDGTRVTPRFATPLEKRLRS